VRDILPVKQAVDMGVDNVFGIARSSATEPSPDSFDNKNLVDIGERVTFDLLTDEVLQNDINPPRGWGIPVTIIQSTVDVHDIMAIAQGLISISIAYDFMRAADMIEPTRERRRCMAISDGITELRNEIHAAETYARAGNVVFSSKARDELLGVRAMKRQVEKLVYERLRIVSANSMPPNSRTWWEQWERRPDPPFIPTPWEAVVDAQ